MIEPCKDLFTLFQVNPKFAAAHMNLGIVLQSVGQVNITRITDNLYLLRCDRNEGFVARLERPRQST